MSRKSGDDATLGCVVQTLLIIFLMPIFGLYLTTKKDASNENRTLGWVLFIVGIVIWVIISI